MKAQRVFYARPRFIINLHKTSLYNNDMIFLQTHLSMFFTLPLFHEQ